MHRKREILEIIVFFILLIIFSFKLITSISFSYMLLIALLPVLFLSLLIADFTSGFVHFLFDNKGQEDTPFWGVLVKPFRDHHINQKDMVQHDFVTLNADNMLGSNVILFICLLLMPTTLSIIQFYIFLILYFTAIILAFTNQFHQWAHADTVPAFVKILQDYHIILSQQHHTIHHQSHTKFYCITTGWNNGWLNKTQFFEKISRFIPNNKEIANLRK